MVTVDEQLQNDFKQLDYGGPKEVMDAIWNAGGTQMVNGQSYLVFTSFNRGGACTSALYSFDPATQQATLVYSNLGWNNQIKLPGRVLQVPPVIPLDAIRARLYPTGGQVLPVDDSESFCITV